MLKIGGNWRPFEKTDIKLRGEFVHQTIDNPQIGFPAATPALEAAFPLRFVRDDGGQLVAVDLRPVNGERSTPRHRPLGLRLHQAACAQQPPSAAQIAAFRQRFAQQGAGAGAAPTSPGSGCRHPREAAPGGPGGGRRGGFGGGRFGGGRRAAV